MSRSTDTLQGMKLWSVLLFLLVACANHVELVEHTEPAPMQPHWGCSTFKSLAGPVKFASCNADQAETVTQQEVDWFACTWDRVACAGRVAEIADCPGDTLIVWVVWIRRSDCAETYAWAHIE